MKNRKFFLKKMDFTEFQLYLPLPEKMFHILCVRWTELKQKAFMFLWQNNLTTWS